MYFGWESLAAPAPVSQKVIQVQLQLGVVVPHASEVVGNSRKPLQQRKRLDLRGQSCGPPRRRGQLLV